MVCIGFPGEEEKQRGNPREFEDSDISKGYVSEPMNKNQCERPVLRERRWRKEMEEYYGED